MTQPLDLAAALPSLAGDGWRKTARRMLDAILALPQVRDRFQRAMAFPKDPFSAAFTSFDLTLAATGQPIPAEGAVMVVANHPYGGADALALGALCLQHRSDVLMLANRMAAEIPALKSATLPLSILGGESAARENAASLRKAMAHLKSGGCLAVFPAGAVAWWQGGGIEEGPWSSHIASLARRMKSPIVPVNFPGRNPWWFYLIGLIHPLIRTAFLPKLLLLSEGKTVKCHAGDMIDPCNHNGLTADEFAAFLRSETLTATAPGRAAM